MAGRNEDGNRRQKSKLDKCIDATSEIRLIGKRVSLVRDVLNGALEGSQERETKKKIRLSIEVLQRDIEPSLSSSANVVAPIPNMGYATKRWNSIKKQQNQKLAVITNKNAKVAPSGSSDAVAALKKVVSGSKPLPPIRKASEAKQLLKS